MEKLQIIHAVLELFIQNNILSFFSLNKKDFPDFITTHALLKCLSAWLAGKGRVSNLKLLKLWPIIWFIMTVTIFGISL